MNWKYLNLNDQSMLEQHYKNPVYFMNVSILLQQCEVVELKQKGVIVKSGHISGIIPTMHLADIPLKMPEKRFIPGKKIKCRVRAEIYRIQLTSRT